MAGLDTNKKKIQHCTALNIIIRRRSNSTLARNQGAVGTTARKKKAPKQKEENPYYWRHNSLKMSYILSDELLGEGSFGKVYHGQFITNAGKRVPCAIKIEDRASSTSLPKQLEYESSTYRFLTEQGVTLVPTFYSFEDEGARHVLVLEQMKMSLQDIKSPLTEMEACSLGILAARALQQIWKAGIVHRDIKPGNICITNDGDVKLIDFGLSKRFRNAQGVHIKYRSQKKLTGTPRFCSLRVSGGSEQGMRDDAESLVYSLLYLVLRRLPWQGIEEDDREEKHRLIYERKKNTTMQELCHGLDCHWGSLLEYLRNLNFEEEPFRMERYFRKIMASLKKGE